MGLPVYVPLVYIGPVAIKKIPVPFCDVCGEPWLPKVKLPDGTHNPIFDHPENSKRCGKCKTTRWNANGVDRRRKPVEQVIPTELILDADELSKIPEVNLVDVLQTIDQGAPKGYSTGRCKHMLYNCPQCHPKEAA
jgi:hypothetical protein